MSLFRSPILGTLMISLLALCIGCNEGEMELDEDSSSKGSGGGVAVDRSTPEKFARAVIDTLANDDETTFDQIICPTKEELITFLKTNAKAKSPSEQARMDRDTERLEQIWDKQREDIQRSFDTARGRLRREGFDLSALRIAKVDYDIRERGGVKMTRGIIVSITDGNRSGRVTIDDTMLVNGQWYSIDDGLRVWHSTSRSKYRKTIARPRSRFGKTR